MDGFMCCLHGTPREFDWCEDNCSRYYSCDTVALADDEFKDREDGDLGQPKQYEVTITETLQKIVVVEAVSRSEARNVVSKDWHDSKHILDAGNFKSVDFEIRRIRKDGDG